MSPAGRQLNSSTSAGTTSLTKNHANTVNTQSADRRLRSNNNNNAASPLRHQTRRSSTSNTPTKSSKNNDLSQRIITILESVPSTISVSAHPSNSLPTNFSSLNTNRNSRSENSSSRRHSHQDQSDDEYNPEEMAGRRSSTSRFNGPIGGKPSSSFKRPGQHLKRGPKKHGNRRDSRQHSLTPSTTTTVAATTNGMGATSQASDLKMTQPLQRLLCKFINLNFLVTY